MGLLIDAPACLKLGLEYCLLLIECVAMRIVGPCSRRICVELDDAVAVAIDTHVEPGAEDVLVDVTEHPRRDFLAIATRLSRMASCRVDDTGCLQLQLDRAVGMEIPEDAI